jgi:hypothetical protein
VDPGCAPNRVLAAHGSNQIADLFRNWRPSGLSVSNLSKSNTNEILDDASR